MKTDSSPLFLRLVKFHCASVMSSNLVWVFVAIGLLIIADSFIGFSCISTVFLPGILCVGLAAQLSMWYGFVLSQFLNAQEMDPMKRAGSRFMGEGEFMSVLPLSLRTLFLSKIFSLALLFGFIFITNILPAILSPHLVISGTSLQIPLLDRLQSALSESVRVDSTHLQLSNGSWILTQLELVFLLWILLVTLASFYFLRGAKSKFLNNARIGVPVALSFLNPLMFGIFFKESLWQIDFFLWFHQWRYFVLGGLTLLLLGFIHFLAKKAEAREFF